MSVERRIVFWVVALVAFLAFMLVFSPILLPFVAGMALAYMLDPVADWFERRGFSRLSATMTILVLFVLAVVVVVLLVVPILINQLTTLVADFPGYVRRVEDLLQELLTSPWAENLGVDPQTVRASVSDYLNQGSRWFTTVIPSIWSGSLAFINLLALAVVTPVVAFYMLYDWDRMVDKVDSWLPRDSVAEIRAIARDIDRVIAGFVRGQALVGLLLGTFYATGLVLLGVNFGFLIGLVSGIISFIPYVGTTLGFVASVGIALVQFWPDWIWIVATATLFVIGQLLEGYVFQPYFIGGNVGLHPVWLMFALFAFGLLFGFVGLLVAIPAAAAVGVLVRYGLRRYLQSPLYWGERGPPAATGETGRAAAKSRKK